jgi:multiple sugar transport system ATP-binding protein
MAQIRLHQVHKAFADFTAVREVSLTIEDGEFFVLLGPSGCGKTTTLRMIAGLELPTSGEIRLGGKDVTYLRARERDIAFVFQLFALYPHMNVRQNIGFPLKCIGMPRSEIRQRVEEAARLLRIDHLLGQRVSRLAGGDRQRVALGRAIVRRPKAFLMDEPLGTLDAAFRELMCEELKALHQRIGATTVYVTHDQIEAMAMADRIAVMDKGQVLQAGTPAEIYHRPRSMFVAAFIGSPSMSFLACDGKVGRGASAVALCGSPIAVPQLHADVPQDRLVLGVRPEHVRLDDASPIRGEVFGVEYMGARQILTVDTEAGRLRLRAPNQVRAEIGELVGLAFQPDRLLLFDPTTERALASDLVPEAAGHG